MNGWQGRRVLVTGAEGFIGSTLVDRLLAEGAEVRALVHYKPYAERGWLAGKEDDVEILAGDVRDQDRVLGAVQGRDVVFHLAALIGIPYSYEAPESYVQTNVVGSFNVATACRRAGARMVHTSTSETYGTARTVPISEDHPLQPQSPYSASKIGADMMVLSMHHAFELPVAVVRPFNTYGPRQSSRAVISTIIKQALAGGPIRLGALWPRRDFTYVADTVAGFVRAAETDGVLGETFNLGTGSDISIGELAAIVQRLAGTDHEIVAEDARERPKESEVNRLLSDNTKARRLIGWAPRTSLEEGLAHTIDWWHGTAAGRDWPNYAI